MDYATIGLHTSIPWREWFDFHVAGIEHYAEHLGWMNLLAETNLAHFPYGIIGNSRDGGGNFTSWATLCRPRGPNYELVAGADRIVAAGIYYQLSEIDITTTRTRFSSNIMDLNDPQGLEIDFSRVSSRRYNNINNWPVLPIRGGDIIDYHDQLQSDQADCDPGPGDPGGCWQWGDLPTELFQWFGAWEPIGGMACRAFQDHLFDYGIALEAYYFYNAPNWGALGNNEIVQMGCKPQRFKVYYFNAVVNSISPPQWQAGQDFVLSGLGFDIPTGDLWAYSFNVALAWDDEVISVDFIGQQGQGTFAVPNANFSQHTNTQITIPGVNMPNLPDGTYEILLTKQNAGMGAGDQIESYAGDWRTEADGKMREDKRLILYVGLPKTAKKSPLILTKWGFKDAEGNVIFRYISEIDVISTSTFYEGDILNMSTLKRGISDKTGLFNISDMTVELQNNTNVYSQILASYILKNQAVEIFYLFDNQPEGFKTEIITMIVDDHDIQGNRLIVQLKDITQKYFKKKTPFYICTQDEYPRIHPGFIGREMPEGLGYNVLTDNPAGAMEAVYIDTVNFKYLAARGSLHSLPQVYSDGNLQALGANYTITYEDGGRTYINFLVNQGEAKITFNFTGYMFGDWNSVNGYVQNPAYVLLFYLAFTLELPVNFLDFQAFHDLADFYVDQSYDEIGKLILQSAKDPKIVVQELSQSFGIATFPAKDGRVRAERKDKSNYQTGLLIFDQFDAMESATRKGGLTEIVNVAKGDYNLFPTCNYFIDRISALRAKSIEDFEDSQEPESPFRFPWITSEVWAQLRLDEELLKRAYGDKKINVIIPIGFTESLDLYANFRYQDPFGISASGEGEQGHYFYIESLTIDWHGFTLELEGVDLQWLLRQCMIIGRCVDLSPDWSTATDVMRMFAYIGRCIEGTFPDGEPNKKICNCQ